MWHFNGIVQAVWNVCQWFLSFHGSQAMVHWAPTSPCQLHRRQAFSCNLWTGCKNQKWCDCYSVPPISIPNPPSMYCIVTHGTRKTDSESLPSSFHPDLSRTIRPWGGKRVWFTYVALQSMDNLLTFGMLHFLLTDYRNTRSLFSIPLNVLLSH